MVQIVVTPEVICLAIALATGAATPATHRSAATERAAEHVTARFEAWLANPSPAASAAIRERVQLGAPPIALIALLEGLQSAPNRDLLDVVQSLASYRRPQVRAHAILAWAELGPDQAARALAAACADLDPSIRRLAPAIAARHPSAEAEQRIIELLERDPALAQALAEDDGVEIEGEL